MYISNRSLAETEYLLEVVLELGFISESEYEKLEESSIDAESLIFAPEDHSKSGE